jgi:hypothetical protein
MPPVLGTVKHIYTHLVLYILNIPMCISLYLNVYMLIRFNRSSIDRPVQLETIGCGGRHLHGESIHIEQFL